MLKKETPPSSEEIARRFDEAAFEGVDLSGLKRDLAEPAQEENLSEYLRQKEAEEMKPGGDLPPSRVPGVKHTSLDRKIEQAKLDKKRKAGTSNPAAGAAKPVDVPPTAIPPTPDQQPYVYRQGDEFVALSEDWKGKPEQEKPIEIDLDDSLKAIRDEVFNVGEKYAKVVGEVDARQGVLRRIMGKNPEKYQESQDAVSEWKQKQEEFGRAFYQNIRSRLKNGEITPEYADQQTKNFDFIMVNHVLDIHGRKFDFKKDFSEGKNWLSSSVAKGYNNFVGKFRKMSFAKKAALGTGIFLTGNFVAIAGWRIAGGLAAGKGAHEGLQAGAEWWRQRKEGKDIQKFEKDLERRNLSVEDKIKLRLGRYESKNNNLEIRMAKYARGDYYRKFASVLLAITVGSGTIARIIQGTGMGGAIREKIFGGGAAATQAHDAFYAHEPDGKITGLTPQGDEHFKQFNIEPHDSPKPEMKAGGNSLINWAESTHAAGTDVHTPEIAKPQFEDIASVKIKAGGNMWGSIENNIKANPSAYGLDPNDPNFTKDMHRMTQQMLDEFAYRKGMSYEQLDQIARTKIRAGDAFKIIHDPSTRDIYIDDFHGKAFGADVSHGGAGAAQEITPNKGSMPVEDTRPRTGAAEHQPGGTRGKVMQYDSDTPTQKIAKENFAKASQHYENVQEYKAKVGPQIDNMSRIAEIRQAIATKPGLIRILNGASFGERADVWNKSATGLYNQIMSHGGYIAHDVISADATKDLNENNIRLMAMFLKFGKPQPGELFENYYQRIFTNSGNIPILNTFISGNIEKLIGHPIK